MQVAAADIVLDELGAFKKERKKRGMWSMNWLLNRQRFSHVNCIIILFIIIIIFHRRVYFISLLDFHSFYRTHPTSLA